MPIIDWWNSLNLAGQIFFCIGFPATLLLLVQTVMMFLGVDDDGGMSDGGVDDVPDDLLDADPDVDDLEALDGGLEGLRILTVRGIVAFLVIFGWVGLAMTMGGSALWLSLLVATVSGLAAMLLVALLMRSVMRLRNDGNVDNRNAIGVAGKVHLTVPPSRTGEGKVHLMLQGAYVERNAVTDDTEPIPTGCEVVVIGVSGQTDLIVRRK